MAKKESPKLVKVAGHRGIYKRGGRYVATFRDADGRSRKQFARTIKEAELLRSKGRADVDRGEYEALSRQTFREYAAAWCASYQGRTERGILPETIAAYRAQLGLKEDGSPTGSGAVAFFRGMRLSAIRPQDLKRYAAHLADEGLSPSTVKRHLAPLRALFAEAVEEGAVRLNPCRGVRVNPRRDETTEEEPLERVRVPTTDEYKKLIQALPLSWRLLVRFLAESGLRIGEAIALEWSDLGALRVHVERRIYKGKVGRPKSKYGIRSVPISEDLQRKLWAQWKERRKKKGHDQRLVFVSERGRRIDPGNFSSRIFADAAKAAGIEWATPHTLRHYCATELFRRGLNPAQVQLWLGHHSAAFTLATYVHLLPEDLPESPFGVGVGNRRATEAAVTDRNDEAAEEARMAL
jgi:integrase